MARLIADLAKRRSGFITFTIVSVAGLWWMWWALIETVDLLRPFGFSMGMAFMLGPQVTLRYLPRPVWFLPLSRRDIWRAGWLCATVGVTLVATAGKLIAMLAHPGAETGGAAGVALSSTYDFAFCGIGCAIAAQATRRHPARAPWRRLSAIGSGLADLTLPLLGFAPIYGLPALHGVVPTRWADFTPISAGVLIAALALTVASYFHSPVPARATPSTTTWRAGAAADRIDRRGMSGLPYLLVHEYLWALGVVAVLGLGSTLFILFAAHIRTPHELVAFVRMELARLDGTVLPPDEGADPFAVVVLVACFAATIAGRYPAMMRHLRVLPLGAGRVQMLLIAWPAAVWLSAWMLFIALHSLFLGEPPRSMHLPAFTAVAGVSALAVALSLRQRGPQHAIAFSSLFVLVPMLLFVGFPPTSALVAIGAGGFAAAIALNRAALRRNETYRHSGMPIALPLTR